jgi:sugar phosphate isomerase/epimerase
MKLACQEGLVPGKSLGEKAVKLEKDLFVAILRELAPHAEAAKAMILVESLNRYETHLLRKQEDSLGISKRVGHASVAIMADFFHMSIEELDIPKAIRKCGKAIRHVHLADSTRMQPGTARTDFRAGFATLREAGFKGYMALECGILGDPEEALPECASFLEECLGE